MVKCIMDLLKKKKVKKKNLQFTDCLCKLKAIEKQLLQIKLEENGN